MKKIVSLMVSVTMLASMLASMLVFFAIPAAAISGIFDTHGKASWLDPEYEGDGGSIAGYSYTADGFHMITADWSSGTPWSHMSTKEKVDLKNGVYMKVRIDSYDYDAGDRWFNFNVWSNPTLEPGSGEEKYGYGVQTLIKFKNNASAENSVLEQINWYTKQFDASGMSGFSEDGRAQVDGKNVITIVITYTPQSGYACTINGSVAPAQVIDYMNNTYAENSEAYIGFTLHSSKNGGAQSATILAFGESESTAIKPMGDDSKMSEDFLSKIADMMDASQIPEGQPGILMTGDKETSDLHSAPSSARGATISITDDYLVRVVSVDEVSDCGVWKVKNEISYDIKDFPVAVCLLKNFCNCGVGRDSCLGYESANLFLCTGKTVTPEMDCQIVGIDSSSPFFIDNGYGVDSYMYFYYDATDELKTEEQEGRFEGRINVTRFDFDIDMRTPGANEFEVVMQCFFRTEEDAKAYMEAYLTELGWVEEEETDAPTETETQPAATEPQETNPQETDSKETDPQETEPQETKPQETEPQETDKQTNAGNTGDSASSGCFGTVGFGAIAIVAVAATAAYVTFKKKD